MSMCKLFMALLCVGACSPAVAQSDSERIRDLERRVGELEKRVSRGNPATVVPGDGGHRVSSNWRRLKRGMSESDVRDLLGEPSQVSTSPVRINWHWPGGGSVVFATGSRSVDGWKEP